MLYALIIWTSINAYQVIGLDLPGDVCHWIAHSVNTNNPDSKYKADCIKIGKAI